MKVIIIAVVALLLFGGAGAGAYFYFQQPAQAASGAAGEHAEGTKEKHAKKSDHSGVSSFVQLDPLILPIIGRDGVTQSVSMVIVIETPDEASKAMVIGLAPRLKDAFIQDMYGVLSQDTMVQNGVIQVTALKARLHKVSNRVLGEGMAKDVLLQVVQQRPM